MDHVDVIVMFSSGVVCYGHLILVNVMNPSPHSPLPSLIPCPVPPRYLSSQYLADSSLSADISQFDFSSGTQVVDISIMLPLYNIITIPET